MWMKRTHDFERSTALCDDSWEERAFAEDAAGLLGGCIWPPRSYHCSFCGREFRSAQALGGHMNVHRRDRARLNQSPNHHNPTQNSVTYCVGVFNPPYPFFQPQVCALLANPGHNPNPNCLSSSVLPEKEASGEQILFPQHSSLSTMLDENNEIRSSISKSEEFESKSIDDYVTHGKEDSCCKRRRIDSSSVPFFSESSSTDQKFDVQSEIISFIDDLDLELRLGCRPMIK